MEGTQKLQELLIEAHHRSLMFNDRGEHVVVDSLFGCALEKLKGMEQGAVQGLLSLGVGECEREHAAVTFDHRQALEFALGMAIGHRSKVTPVHLAWGAGWGLKAEEGGLRFRAWAHAT